MLTTINDMSKDSIIVSLSLDKKGTEVLKLIIDKIEYHSAASRHTIPKTYNWVYYRRSYSLPEAKGIHVMPFKEAKMIQKLVLHNEMTPDYQNFLIGTSNKEDIAEDDLKRGIDFTQDVLNRLVFTPYRWWYGNTNGRDFRPEASFPLKPLFNKLKAQTMSLLNLARSVYKDNKEDIIEVYDRWLEAGRQENVLKLDIKEFIPHPKKPSVIYNLSKSIERRPDAIDPVFEMMKGDEDFMRAVTSKEEL